ncbi:MAG: GFA family protein, partial [Rhodobacteraceae bacterium]|nr:GFA family protein [Paracoccaceae bacterium]
MHQKTCFCGKLKIKTPATPLLHFVCHCKDCDALWNGLYMGLVFPTDEIELSGEQR